MYTYQEIPYIEFKYVYADIMWSMTQFTHAQRVPSWDLSHESCNTIIFYAEQQ